MSTGFARHIRLRRRNRDLPEPLPGSKRINWLNLSTVVAVAILVGTEMVGASWAAGWALGGLMQLNPIVSRAIEAVFAVCGFVLLYYFMRTAIRHEPFRR
jgi:hypothetical protein